MNRLLLLLTATICTAMVSSEASAQLFRDEMVDGSTWTTAASSADNTATFGYDYSADGIPEAPNTLVGDTATSGVKLESNNTDFVDSGQNFTLFPTGQNFTGNYQLTFDAWQNYSTFDREQGGGSGTTEFLGGGIGHDSIQDSVGVAGSGHQIITTNEGGSGSDYRAFENDVFIDGALMFTGSRNATCCGPGSVYEVLFPEASGVPPASQGQTGDPLNGNRAGSSAFQWYTHTINAHDGVIRHRMTNQDGLTLPILTYDATDSTDGNISIFYADFFSSVSPSAALTFGIVDNVTVSVPEPTSMLLVGLGCVCLAATRRNK